MNTNPEENAQIKVNINVVPFNRAIINIVSKDSEEEIQKTKEKVSYTVPTTTGINFIFIKTDNLNGG